MRQAFYPFLIIFTALLVFIAFGGSTYSLLGLLVAVLVALVLVRLLDGRSP